MTVRQVTLVCLLAWVLAWVPAPSAEASLASIGYAVLGWLDRADIERHVMTATVVPAEWTASFTDDITFTSDGRRSFHVLLGKDARLDRVYHPESGESVAFNRSISIGAVPFHIYRIELPRTVDPSRFTLRFEWTIDASTIRFFNPFLSQHYTFFNYVSFWYPNMPVESFFEADMTILTPPGYEAFAEGSPWRGEEIGVEDGSAQSVHRYRTVAPVNGIGLGVGYFQRDTTIRSGPYVVEVWRPRSVPSRVNQVGLATARALSFLSDRLGPLPVETVRVAEFPFGHGVSFGNLSDTVYGGDLGVLGIRSDVDYALLAAHEATHKWLGASVGVKVVGGAWLLEGLAEYLGYLALAATDSPRSAGDRYEDRTYRAFAANGVERQRSIGAIELFDLDAQWIYAKAPGIFRMLHRRLGTDGFFAAVRSFLEAHRGMHVAGRDFENWIVRNALPSADDVLSANPRAWNDPGASAEGDLSAFFRTWIHSDRRLDYALDVGMGPGEEGAPGPVTFTIGVRSVGNWVEPGPVDVEFRFPDGERRRLSVGVGETRTLTLPARPTEILLDPDRWLLDADPANNRWIPA